MNYVSIEKLRVEAVESALHPFRRLFPYAYLSACRRIAFAITTDCALPHENRHERTRQPYLAKGQEWPRCRVCKLEFVVDDEMREDHLHNNRYVEARRAVDS